MDYKVTLPQGVNQKKVFYNGETFLVIADQIMSNTELANQYPSIFKEVNGIKAELKSTPKEAVIIEAKEELIVETPTPAEPEGELLVETPVAVEVEIVPEEADEEAPMSLTDMTIKELKAVAVEKGIELTSTKKKDIIAEILA